MHNVLYLLASTPYDEYMCPCMSLLYHRPDIFSRPIHLWPGFVTKHLPNRLAGFTINFLNSEISNGSLYKCDTLTKTLETGQSAQNIHENNLKDQNRNDFCRVVFHDDTVSAFNASGETFSIRQAKRRYTGLTDLLWVVLVGFVQASPHREGSRKI